MIKHCKGKCQNDAFCNILNGSCNCLPGFEETWQSAKDNTLTLKYHKTENCGCLIEPYIFVFVGLLIALIIIISVAIFIKSNNVFKRSAIISMKENGEQSKLPSIPVTQVQSYSDSNIIYEEVNNPKDPKVEFSKTEIFMDQQYQIPFNHENLDNTFKKSSRMLNQSHENNEQQNLPSIPSAQVKEYPSSNNIYEEMKNPNDSKNHTEITSTEILLDQYQDPFDLYKVEPKQLD